MEDWALILAAGEGTRLRELTTGRDGVAIPKQYCSFGGGASLLAAALRRATRVAARDRTVAVVAGDHRRYWSHELRRFPATHVVVQPANRGTAAGIVLPLLAIAARDPGAVVAILPSDHFVAREAVLGSALRTAVRSVRRAGSGIVLLGIAPDEPDAQYGWIVPGGNGVDGLCDVGAFVEKPPVARARELMVAGGVWSSFIIAGDVRTLLALCERRVPEVVATLRAARGDEQALRAAYATLPCRDFSRDVLEGAEAELRLLRVPDCGWSDLGTPARVAACVAEHGAPPRTFGQPAALLDLTAALACENAVKPARAPAHPTLVAAAPGAA